MTTKELIDNLAIKVEGENAKREITIFTLSTCMWCKKCKAWLNGRNIKYRYVDMDKIQASQKSEIYSPRPFRLVKFFSYTGLGLVLITTMVLSWVISNYAKKVMLQRSESYSLLLAEHVNRQVFLQFVLPTALRYGEIALRNPAQFKRLDTVVRNTTEGLKVDSVTIFDSKENIISYSTLPDEVGVRDMGGIEYERALNGNSNSRLISKASLLNLIPGSEPISSKLMTFIPFRRENPLSERTDEIMGVTKVVQDLSDDMEAVLRLQLSIIVISILIMGTLFIILTQIVTKADQINEARAQERRRLEDKLHHAERLASLGEMVASVSHEIKNPLGIVRSTAEILNKRLKDQAPTSKHLAEIIINCADNELGGLQEKDVVVLTSKIVSKAAGRVRKLSEVKPGKRARAISKRTGKDAKWLQMIFDEGHEIVAIMPLKGIIRQHIVNSAGVDQQCTSQLIEHEQAVCITRGRDGRIHTCGR